MAAVVGRILRAGVPVHLIAFTRAPTAREDCAVRDKEKTLYIGDIAGKTASLIACHDILISKTR